MRCNTSLALRVGVVPRWRFGLVSSLAGASGWCRPSLALRVGVVPRWRFGLVFDPRPFSGDNLSEPPPNLPPEHADAATLLPRPTGPPRVDAHPRRRRVRP